MPAATTLPAKIIDLDACDCSSKLAKTYNGRELTVEEFDTAMQRFAAERRREGKTGGYAKLRGKFVCGDDVIEFRIDVTHDLCEGRTLAQVWKKRAVHATTERGREYLRACGGNPDEIAALYQRAAFVCI